MHIHTPSGTHTNAHKQTQAHTQSQSMRITQQAPALLLCVKEYFLLLFPHTLRHLSCSMTTLCIRTLSRHAHTQTNTHTHTHTHTRTHTHAHTHTHTHTLFFNRCCTDCCYHLEIYWTMNRCLCAVYFPNALVVCVCVFVCVCVCVCVLICVYCTMNRCLCAIVFLKALAPFPALNPVCV